MAHTSQETPFLEGSLKMLAETFGMAVSSLKEVLKRSDQALLSEQLVEDEQLSQNLQSSNAV